MILLSQAQSDRAILAKQIGISMERLHGTDKGQDRSVSFFATASYAYANRYILAVSARLDGADIIGTDNRFSPLWNVSLKWNIHEEPFMRNVAFVNVLSLRGSYGFTGSIDRNAYPFTLMSFGELHYYEGIQVPTRITPGNPSVRWQKKEDRSEIGRASCRERVCQYV